MPSVAEALPFDVDNPPHDPPEGCTDPLIWKIAYQLFRTHQPQPCRECAHGLLCAGRQLAQQGLAVACGAESVMANYWRGLAEIRRREGVTP